VLDEVLREETVDLVDVVLGEDGLHCRQHGLEMLLVRLAHVPSSALVGRVA
jgi:hypothetical protein